VASCSFVYTYQRFHQIFVHTLKSSSTLKMDVPRSLQVGTAKTYGITAGADTSTASDFWRQQTLQRFGRLPTTSRHDEETRKTLTLSHCIVKSKYDCGKHWVCNSHFGHTLRRNCLVKHVTEGKIEGKIEVTGRRGRRRKQLPDGLKQTTGYWKFKDEALASRTRFGRGYGPVVRKTT
jgi:hypothetical protein